MLMLFFSRLGIRALYAGDDKIAVGCCNFFIVCRFFMDDDFSQTRESRYCFYAKYNVVCGEGERIAPLHYYSHGQKINTAKKMGMRKNNTNIAQKHPFRSPPNSPTMFKISPMG